MRELEVKVLDIDKEDIELKLVLAGAKLVKDEEQINIRFDTDDNFLRNTKNGYVRIRIAKNLTTGKIKKTLTLKENISRDGYRVNEETETEISDEEALIKIIEGLGYKRKRPGYKHRRSFEYENILFEIDTWDKDTYPKPYLEIEVTSEVDLDRAIKLLNIKKDRITTKSIDELRKD